MTQPNNQNQGASIEAERAGPCPFCGGENVKAHVYAFVLGDGEPDAYCQCGDCSTTGPNGKDEASAIAAWNRRTPATTTGELPPLPEPHQAAGEDAGCWFPDFFDARQMQAYARAAIEADRARLAPPHVVKIHKSGKKGSKRHQYEMSDGSVQEMDEMDALKSVASYANSLKARDAQIADLHAQLAATTENLQTAVQQAWRANAALTALRAQLARQGQGEPVAAQFKMPGETWEECSIDEQEVMLKHGFKFRYLYAAPASAQPADPHCKWPLCQSEEVQQQVADQVHRELYSGAQPDQREDTKK